MKHWLSEEAKSLLKSLLNKNVNIKNTIINKLILAKGKNSHLRNQSSPVLFKYKLGFSL